MSVVLPPQLEQGVVPDLDSEEENEVLTEVAQEIADEIHEWTRDILKNPPSPAVKLQPKEQFERFMLLIVQTYPTNALARMLEVSWLRNPEYLDMINEGALPPPASMPWAGLLPYGFAFRLLQDEFEALYKRYAGI